MTQGLPAIADGWSSPVRPALHGVAGAISAAHPLAVAAGQAMFGAGGSAADAVIAAQAVLCVVAPDACGLGGDMFALIDQGGQTIAINGSGAAPQGLAEASTDGANSVTVPGLVDAWATLHAGWGRLPLADVLRPALGYAHGGVRLSPDLADAVVRHRGRLIVGGAERWVLMALQAGDCFLQPQLAALLAAIGESGAGAFYRGAAAAAIVGAVQSGGGVLDLADLNAHRTKTPPPIVVRFGPVEVAVQPPAAQGVLLAMALQALDRLPSFDEKAADHVAIELTEASFAHRAEVGSGRALLEKPLLIDADRAAGRGGPRAYLHTAGVSAADVDGLVISSLVSVFDDFGSCLFVPQLGITLNNRAGGFTHGSNAAAPGKRPVHTLAPAMVRSARGSIALATPGADGQVQTLLQVIDRACRRGEDLAIAIAAARWRSEGGAVLIERGHPALDALTARGHDLRQLDPGDLRFGAIACAGITEGSPFAIADWRRRSWAGVA